VSDCPCVHSNGFHIKFDSNFPHPLAKLFPHWIGNEMTDLHEEEDRNGVALKQENQDVTPKDCNGKQ